MEDEEEIAGISGKIKDKRILNILPHQYKKGQSGNPSGKAKGTKSLKTYIKEKLEKMSDEECELYLEGIDKRSIWEMAEGKAKQDLEVSGELNSKIIRLNE